jgi:hypothetical protein
MTKCPATGELQWIGVVFHHLHRWLHVLVVVFRHRLCRLVAKEDAVAPGRGTLGAQTTT